MVSKKPNAEGCIVSNSIYVKGLQEANLERRWLQAREGGREGWGVTADCGAPLWSADSVLELDRGGDCITL